MAARKRRPIQASEISAYLYCARAWWYRRQGLEPDDPARLAAGTRAHWSHGRRVWRAKVLRGAAYALLALAVIWLAVYAALRLVGG